ncbi:phage major capsid protein [Mesorhizobium microcysteis]|uniref:Phage major capsid protein n=1 Tax=Neoaquamicrobium microcysteis TaxID=2682781 RepID=A0A5D4GUP5_9HYPH|nr:phage major capsid protein [Mesorhizobium microcysteis]TYR32088.1 phage major capsid protein [Mesorhizobium microcysteis]
MTHHNRYFTRAAAALLASGAAIHRKDDPLELLTKSFEDHHKTVDEILAKHSQKAEELQARMFELEQKGARRSMAGYGSGPVSAGAEVSQRMQDLAHVYDDKRAKARIEVKAITSDVASAGALASPDRQQGITMLPKQRLTIRDLLGKGRTTSNSVEYMEQTGFTNNAAMVAEGGLKPESDISFAFKDTKVKTIAHWVKASRQILADAPLLQTTIDTELRYGLALIEEYQLLMGDGTGQNLFGLIPQATDYETTRNLPGDTRFDTLLHAIEQAEVALLPASGIILNTSDWFAMLGIKDGDGRYISGGPLANVPERVWRLPVVWTNVMPAGTFMVGAFETAATIYDREDATVELGYEGDDFIRNLLTILGEERLAFAVKRPEALIHGEFPAGVEE